MEGLQHQTKQSHGDFKGPRVARLTVQGSPRPLCRPRVGQGTIFDHQKQEKLVFGISLQAQLDDAPPFSGPVNLNISFYLPIIRTRNIMLCGKPHNQYPDLESLIKYVCSASLGILYNDNNMIACLVARKFYSTTPRTEIIISELEEESW